MGIDNASGQASFVDQGGLGAAGVVRVSAVLAASVDRVWRAFTDDAELAAWYWPRQLGPSVTADPRPGGRYRISAASPQMAVVGEYLQVVAPHRLVLSWRWDGEDEVSTVTIELTEVDGGTVLALSHEDLGAEAVASHLQGWTDCLDRLPAHLRVWRAATAAGTGVTFD
jgi:uncharacterized protein YndB with AHSA1/START domain